MIDRGANRWLILLGLILAFPCQVDASSHDVGSRDAGTEIEYLIRTVGESGCTFIRNGAEHSAPDAEKHLRLKYRNGRAWVKSAPQFIERLASKSSWTGKPYLIQCSDGGHQPLDSWLMAALDRHRSAPPEVD